MKKPFIVGIAGGSGSGKTTLAAGLQKHFGAESASIIYQDSYYLDQSRHFDKDGGKVNFDHPESLEFGLLAKHLVDLKNLKSIEIPIYDFASHSRKANVQVLKPNAIVFVDGILILSQPDIIKNLDFSIYVDAPEKIRFERRLRRDTLERGRSEEGVWAQINAQVKPMHDQFVEPSKERANLVLSGVDTPSDLVQKAAQAIVNKMA